MDARSIELTIKALDGLNTRAEVTAQNIANAGTPSYRPMRVTFEDALAAAAARGGDAIRTVEPRIEPAEIPRVGDPGLRLDLELATASSTALRYSAILDVLGRQLQTQDLAITGNR